GWGITDFNRDPTWEGLFNGACLGLSLVERLVRNRTLADSNNRVSVLTTERPAKPPPPVQIRAAPPNFLNVFVILVVGSATERPEGNQKGNHPTQNLRLTRCVAQAQRSQRPRILALRASTWQMQSRHEGVPNVLLH